MTIINNIDGTRFEINGAKYLKNFISVIAGENVKIVNIYDSRLELQCFKHFSEFTVNGNTFASAFDLQTALLPILFTRASLSGGVPPELNFVQTVTGTAVNNADPFNPIINLPEGSVGDGAAADVRNLQARLVFNLEENVTIQNGESFDLTPNAVISNTFNSLLTLDTVNRVIKTFNTEQLNLTIRLFLQLSSGALVAYDVALQRANETDLIEQTKQQVLRRPDQGAATGGPTAVVLSSFTSGVNDPFNDVGFKITFFNPSGQTITLIAGVIISDIFAVYNVGLQTIIANTIFVSQHNDFKFDSNYTVGTPTEPATGPLVLNLENAVVGNVVIMIYSGETLPDFVTQWPYGTDEFTPNETLYYGIHLHKPEGGGSIITGVVTKLPNNL